jgi:hypothetical protein
MGRGEKVLLIFFPLATKHWNLPLAIELGFSFTPFLLLLFKRANSDHLGLFLFGHNFLFKFREYLFSQPSLVGED